MKRYTTVLFDLDGTLIDTSKGVIASVLYTLEKLGYPRGDFGDYIPFLGPPLTYGFGVVCGMDERDVPRAIEVFRARYIGEEWFLRSKVYQGIPELLSSLRAAGFRIAVTTSKLQLAAEKTLTKFGLYGSFDLVVGSANADGRQTKEGVVRYALSEIGATPDEAVLVGDRYFDAEGARGAGVDCVAALWGFGKKEEFGPFPVVGYANEPKDVARLLSGAAE